MMTGHLATQQWVPFPVELVFAFFANPSNLPHLMPQALKARLEDVRLEAPPARPLAADAARRFRSVAAGEGSEILISFCPIPLIPQRVSWTARITEFVWNSHFIDEQIRGPFARFHHRHGTIARVRDGVEGTLVTDAVEYALPLGFLGRMAAGVVHKQLEKQFEFRQKKLPEALTVAAQQAIQRA
jgi:ligand-binding SRPBCC domain-containing protein